jgi:hypothetical protein
MTDASTTCEAVPTYGLSEMSQGYSLAALNRTLALTLAKTNLRLAMTWYMTVEIPARMRASHDDVERMRAFAETMHQLERLKASIPKMSAAEADRHLQSLRTAGVSCATGQPLIASMDAWIDRLDRSILN